MIKLDDPYNTHSESVQNPYHAHSNYHMNTLDLHDISPYNLTSSKVDELLCSIEKRARIPHNYSNIIYSNDSGHNSIGEIDTSSDKFTEDFVFLDPFPKSTSPPYFTKNTLSDTPTVTLSTQSKIKSKTKATPKKRVPSKPNSIKADQNPLTTLTRRKSSVLEDIFSEPNRTIVHRECSETSKSYDNIVDFHILDKPSSGKLSFKFPKFNFSKLGLALKSRKNKKEKSSPGASIKMNTSLQFTKSTNCKDQNHIPNFIQPNTINLGERDYRKINDYSSQIYAEQADINLDIDADSRLNFKKQTNPNSHTKSNFDRSTEYSLDSDQESIVDKIEMISEYQRIIKRLETNKSLLESRIAVQKAHLHLFMSNINKKYDSLSNQNDDLRKKLLQMRRSNKMMIDDLINLVESKEDEIFELELKLDNP